MIHIFIVDDQAIIREGVRTLLSEASKIEILGYAKNGEGALQKIAELQPDVVLLDINLPDTDGLAVAEKIGYRFPQIRTIILSSHEEESYVEKAKSLGAKGYLSKNISSEELEWSIKLVAQGYSVIKPNSLIEEPQVERQRVERQRVEKPKVSPSKTHARSYQTVASDLNSNLNYNGGADFVRVAQKSHLPNLPKSDREMSNLDGIEDLLAKNHIQTKYAKYGRGRNRLSPNSKLARLIKTITSFEFGLLMLIVLFSLSFLAMVALS